VASAVERLAGWLPEGDLPPAPGSVHRMLVRQGDRFLWEGEPIDPSRRIE